MATLNQWFGIGRLGNNPDEIKLSKEGKPYTQFSLAVDQGNNQTLWLQITAWEKTAEFAVKHIHKGMQVFVQGKLLVRPYKDKQQIDRVSVEINAGNVQLLEKQQKGDDITNSVLPES